MAHAARRQNEHHNRHHIFTHETREILRSAPHLLRKAYERLTDTQRKVMDVIWQPGEDLSGFLREMPVGTINQAARKLMIARSRVLFIAVAATATLKTEVELAVSAHRAEEMRRLRIVRDYSTL